MTTPTPANPNLPSCIPCVCPEPEIPACPVSYAPCPPVVRPDPPFSTYTPDLDSSSLILPSPVTSPDPPSILDESLLSFTDPEDNDAGKTNDDGFLDEGWRNIFH